jgi:hypothetical protein
MSYILAGKYKLIETLGKGASCEVKLAKLLGNENINNESYAVKIMVNQN